jgi:hypothetical protein
MGKLGGTMPDRRKKTVDIRELVLQMRQSDTDRAVQRATGMHRQTVKRYRSWAAAHGLLTAAPLPALAELQQLVDATLAEPKPPQNTSSVEPHRATVQQLRQEGVEMTAICQRNNHGRVTRHGGFSFTSNCRTCADSPIIWRMVKRSP